MRPEQVWKYAKLVATVPVAASAASAPGAKEGEPPPPTAAADRPGCRPGHGGRSDGHASPGRTRHPLVIPTKETKTAKTRKGCDAPRSW